MSDSGDVKLALYSKALKTSTLEELFTDCGIKMDVLSTLSSYLYWGESAEDEQDGSFTTPEDPNNLMIGELEEGGGVEMEEEEWILVGKKGRSVKRKHEDNEEEEEEQEDPLPFPNEDYDLADSEDKENQDPLPFPNEDYEEPSNSLKQPKTEVKYVYGSYRDSLLRRPRRIISMEACDDADDNEDSDDEDDSASFAPLFEQILTPLPDKQMGCKTQTPKRPPIKDLKRQVKTVSRRNDRKSLKRTNQVKQRDIGAKRQKQMGRMHGKQGGKGGQRCGWH